jgi:hypothetical protein
MGSKQARIRFVLIAGVLGAFWLSMWLPSLTSAAPANLPPRPTSKPTTAAPPSTQPLVGGFIELQLQPSQEDVWAVFPWQGLWTIIQWQDAFGDWHGVEGWRGALDEIKDGVGTKLWWVAEADLRKGPFRWVVYENPGGDLLATSESFYLPGATGERVTVEVPLAP